ncbi:hypothetical protein K6959_13805 [Bacillus aquiflavi]|uniref:hypothetical protein n=1 Tax=Bacillus aquiflavi TaxID=2672567 RepID=UPI001CA9CE4F|nr:hypothetical protein [Bacillus aquiflavi]UAC47689.1 hypothetical protein K6959_13805 [Bacillus aquiflavi]
MTIVPDYVIELKSIVMLSQLDDKSVNLMNYVNRLEKSIMTDDNKTMDKKVELDRLHFAYKLVLDELLVFKK